jgi:RNA polymerase sigma-70 factor (ECF subfamily)
MDADPDLRSKTVGEESSMRLELISKARRGDEESFHALVSPLRSELQLHCYRILGSSNDAEDAVQDSFLAAWKGLAGFDQRSAVRTWLYRIATNRCLDLLRAGGRRGGADPHIPHAALPEPSGVGDVLWLEPYPDSLLEGIADPTPGPEARYDTQEAVSLAFATALQLLPPRQRAVLILRDVLGYHTAEVARMLDATDGSVTSALRHARETLRYHKPDRDEMPPLPESAIEKAIVERFVVAFEAHDVESVVSLLADDVRFAMPPMPFEWHGSDRAAQFLVATGAQRRRLIPTRANGQPAFGLYIPDPNTQIMHALGLLVLSLSGDQISTITRFDKSVLDVFGLPRTLRSQGPE